MTYPFHFSGTADELQEQIRDLISHFTGYMITCASLDQILMIQLNLIQLVFNPLTHFYLRPILLTRLNFHPAWISNYTHYKM